MPATRTRFKDGMSISTRLLGYLLVAGLVPMLLMGAASFELSRRIVFDLAGELQLQQVSSLRTYLELYADQVESLAANLAGNEAIGKALRDGGSSADEPTNSYQNLDAHAQIGYILNGYVRVKGLISIDLISIDGRHYHVGDTLDTSDVSLQRVSAMQEEARKSEAAVIWRGIEANLNEASTKKQALVASREIRYFVPQSGQSEVVGLLVINIDPVVVFNSFLVTQKNPLRVLSIDRRGGFVFHTNADHIGQQASEAFLKALSSGPAIQQMELDGIPVVLAQLESPRTGGYLIAAQPRRVLSEPINVLLYAGAAFLMTGALLIALLARRFAKQVVQPVRNVSDGFRHLQNEDAPPLLPLPLPAANDEMAHMVNGFNRYLEVLSAQKRAADELLEAQHAAESANRAKSQFLATMSHEIRTPMNAVLGMAQLQMMEETTDEERREYAQTILDSGQVLLALLNDILDLSKVEAGKLELGHSEFNVNLLLRDTESLFLEQARSKGLYFEARWCSGTPEIYVGDPQRLRQMLANLASNAIKFTREGGVVVEGKIAEMYDLAADLEFSVTDTGIGIATENINQLFQPFSQVDGSLTRKFGGTGLGLSIVKSFATLMQGGAGVESTVGKGSRFWFRIRVERAADRPSKTQMRRGPLSTISLDVPSAKALVVEDNATNRKVVKAFLEKLGVSVETATNGREALQIIQTGQQYDFVLMDCQMPVMDGLEATRRIRAWEHGAMDREPLPIIALTASAFESDKQKCLASGMSDYLAKPIDYVKLRERLGKWCPSLSS